MHPERVMFEALFKVIHLLSLQQRFVVELLHGVVVMLACFAVEVVEDRADGFCGFACAPDSICAAE